MCMFQVKIFFSNGTIMRSSPMNRTLADNMVVSFVGRPDVMSILSEPIEKSTAQATLRIDAQDWKKYAEGMRQRPDGFDPENDRLAVKHYNQAMTLGYSG